MKGKLQKTTQQFIEELEIVFSGKPYTFQKTVYTGARNYSIVTCSIHGDWTAMATNLQQGKGCRGCRTDSTANARRKTTEYFIERSKSIHGDRYDYSKSVYVNNSTNVEILCKEHGAFFQQPVAHYNGSGCTACVKRDVKTLFDFKRHISNDLLKLWEFKGLTDESVVKVTSPVVVYCNKHGETFNSTLSSLYRRESCCNVSRAILVSESKTKEFSFYVEKMNKIHNGRYEYLDELGKVSKYHKINILCKEHGVFSQDIEHHLNRKQGCNACAMLERGRVKSKKWVDSLPDKLNKMHLQNVKIVSISDVQSSLDKITLSCDEHGIFEKTYGNLKLGQRCPLCSVYEGWGKDTYIQRSKDMYDGVCNLYFIKCFNDSEMFYKIGITVHKDIRRRFVKSTIPYDYEIIEFIEADVESVVEYETFIHKAMKDFHYLPNIPFGGYVRECFSKEGFDRATELLREFKEAK